MLQPDSQSRLDSAPFDRDETVIADHASTVHSDGPSKVTTSESLCLGVSDQKLYEAAVKAVTRQDRLALFDLW